MADTETEAGTDPGAATTRDRVLNAAVKRFMREPYDKATLRSIAGEAGVDVAYVHRLFGSKQLLFREVLSVIQARVLEQWFEEGDFLEVLTAASRRHGGLLTVEGGNPIDLFIHSIGSPEATAEIGEFIRTHTLKRFEEGLGGPDAARKAEKLFAFLIGSRIARRYIGLNSLEGRAPEEAGEWLSEAIVALCRDD